MNTDENMETPGSLRISAIPTVLVFQQGKEVDRLVGVNPETKFKAALDKLVSPEPCRVRAPGSIAAGRRGFSVIRRLTALREGPSRVAFRESSSRSAG